MSLHVIKIDPSNVDADGIADALPAGTDWVFGVDAEWLANSAGDSLAHQLVITTEGNEAAANTPLLTLTGTDAEGNIIEETVALPDTASIETSKYFKTVALGTTGANATIAAFDIGWVDEVQSEFIPLNFRENVSAGAFQLDVTGTISVNVEFTVADPNRFSEASLVPVNADGDLTNETSDVTAFIGEVGFTAFRVVLNSYSSAAEVTLYVSQP